MATLIRMNERHLMQLHTPLSEKSMNGICGHIQLNFFISLRIFFRLYVTANSCSNTIFMDRAPFLNPALESLLNEFSGFLVLSSALESGIFGLEIVAVSRTRNSKQVT